MRHRSHWNDRYRSFGSEDRIKKLKNDLAKNEAVRDQTPIVAFTDSGNLGVYGAMGAHVAAFSPGKVADVQHALDRFVRNSAPAE